MKLAKRSTGQPMENSKGNIFQSPGRTVAGYLEISQHSSEDDLEKIRIGTPVRSVDGKLGIVADIEILRRGAEVQYYFRLEKSMGTILVIK